MGCSPSLFLAGFYVEGLSGLGHFKVSSAFLVQVLQKLAFTASDNALTQLLLIFLGFQ
jgi:hypothetical protein